VEWAAFLTHINSKMYLPFSSVNLPTGALLFSFLSLQISGQNVNKKLVRLF